MPPGERHEPTEHARVADSEALSAYQEHFAQLGHLSPAIAYATHVLPVMQHLAAAEATAFLANPRSELSRG